MKKNIPFLFLLIFLLSSCNTIFFKNSDIHEEKTIIKTWIYFDETDQKWKDEYWVCYTCTPENWFTKDGWELDESWKYDKYIFTNNRQCERIAYEEWRCIKWWFKITWYVNEKEIFCAITWWKVVSWIDECERDWKIKNLDKYFDEYFQKNDQNLPPLELIKANKISTDLSAEINLSNCKDIEKLETYLIYSCDATINEIFTKNTDKEIKIWDILKYRKFRENYDNFKSEDMNNKKKLVSVKFDTFENENFIIEPDVAFGFDYSDELNELFKKD